MTLYTIITVHITERRRKWGVGYREARAQAIIVAVVLWVAAAIATFATPGARSLTGRLKGGDFIHFYSLGHMALQGTYPRLGDAGRLHDLQVRLLPSSHPEVYVPVNPPQTALVFAPFARLSYFAAALIWAAILCAAYSFVVYYTWHDNRDVLTDGVFVAAAAAAFAPFWNLVLFGQTTVFPLAAFFLGWLALRRNHEFIAGLAFGLLAIKPQFALVLAVLLPLTGQWWVILGALACAAVQGVAVVGVLGIDAIWVTLENARGLRDIEPLLEPRPWQMHSLRTLTNLAPAPLSSVLWFLGSGAILGMVVQAWRTPAPVDARFGLVVIASVLVNPHVNVYDATVLVLPVLWLSTWLQSQHRTRAHDFWNAVYLLCLLLLLPTAWLVRVQASVLIMLWIVWSVYRTMSASVANPHRLTT